MSCGQIKTSLIQYFNFHQGQAHTKTEEQPRPPCLHSWAWVAQWRPQNAQRNR